MRMNLVICLATALLMSASAVFAESRPLRVNRVLAEQEQLRTELEAASGRAAKISPARRADLLVRQQELLDLLKGKKSTSELTEAQQLFTTDTLAWIEAAVQDDNDDRVVCRREKTLGSNRIKQICRTVGQMQRDQELAREAVRAGSHD